MATGTQLGTIITTFSLERSPLIKESGHAVQKDKIKLTNSFFTQPLFYSVAISLKLLIGAITKYPTSSLIY